jgi:hypothetical protein
MALVCLILIGLYAGTIGVLAYYIEHESHAYLLWKGSKQAKDNIALALVENAVAWDDLRQELEGRASQETLEKLEVCDAKVAAVRKTVGTEFVNIFRAEDKFLVRMLNLATIPFAVLAGAGGFVMLVLSILLTAAARPASHISDWEWEKKHYRKI